MSTRAILTEMLETLQAETEAVKRADTPAILEGVSRHEALLAQLQDAARDLSPEETRALVEQIERERFKLKSLLESQSARTDFLLKLVGVGQEKGIGYPGTGWGQEPRPHRLNRRT